MTIPKTVSAASIQISFWISSCYLFDFPKSCHSCFHSDPLVDIKAPGIYLTIPKTVMAASIQVLSKEISQELSACLFDRLSPLIPLTDRQNKL